MAQERASPTKSEHLVITSNSTVPPENVKIFNRSAFIDIISATSPKIFRRQTVTPDEESSHLSQAEKRVLQEKRVAERREIVKAEITSKLEQEHEEANEKGVFLAPGVGRQILVVVLQRVG